MESTASTRRTPLLEHSNRNISDPNPKQNESQGVIHSHSVSQQRSLTSNSSATTLVQSVSCRIHRYKPPILTWIRSYKTLSQDCLAGVTVGLMIIPQSMSYAKLAGLSVQYGLYSSMVPLYCYSCFGTCRQLAVGPVAMISLLLNSGLSGILQDTKTGDDDTSYQALYEQLALQTSFLVGMLYILMGLLNMGSIVNFLSHSVISGFTTGAAVIIGCSQLKYILGYNISRSDKLQHIVMGVWQNRKQFHVGTFAMGILFILLLSLLKHLGRRSERFKLAKSAGPLLVTVLGVALTVGFGLSNHGIAVVGEIPSGLPSFTAHKWFPLDTRIFPTVLGIVLVGFMESIAISKQLASLHGYDIDASDELMGLGISNLFGGCFQSYPITGSFSRSAVNNESGAQTPLTGCFTATVVLVAVLFLTPLFQVLPLNALAAIVISGVAGLLDIKEARHLWKTNSVDLVTWSTACLGTLFVGVERGLALAVLVSLIVLVVRSAFPPVALLGRLSGTNLYRNIDHYNEIEQLTGISVVSIGSSLHFANIQHCMDRMEALIAQCDRHPVRFIVIDMTSVAHLDSAAVVGLETLVETSATKGRTVYFANPGPRLVHSLLECECIDDSKLFIDMHDAVLHCLSQLGDDEEQQPTVEMVEEKLDESPTRTTQISRRRHGSPTPPL